MTLDRECSDCGRVKQIEVPDAGYIAWQKGTLIQHAMPEVSKEDRELLISGICGTCFDKLFPY